MCSTQTAAFVKRPVVKVKHPWPLVRDPNLFFRTAEGMAKNYPPPFNSNGHDHSGIQPVTYNKVNHCHNGQIYEFCYAQVTVIYT